MKTLNLKKLLPFIVWIGNQLIQPSNSFAQCSLTAPAVASCSGGNGAAHNNTNINLGQTYWYSSNGTLANVNMAGGTLRVCGTLNLSSLDFNSGTIIVEQGGKLTISNSSEMLLSGLCFLVNRGSLTINGNLQLRNLFNVVWNDNATAVFTVNGSINLNSASSYILNKGILKATSLIIQSNADENSICMRDNAIMSLGSIINNANDAFSYSGTGSPGCISIAGAYTLNQPFTSSSALSVCKTTGAAGSIENWGAATVTSGCSGCSSVLPILVSEFNAIKQNNAVKVSWNADNSTSRETFFIEKSTDGLYFSTIGVMSAQQGKTAYTFYDASVNNPEQYYRIRIAGQDIHTSYSSIALVKNNTNGRLNVYPNPVMNSNTVSISYVAATAENIQLSLTNAEGKMIIQKKGYVNTGNNIIGLELNNVPAGIYFMRIQSPSIGISYRRVTVIAGK